MKQPRSLNAGCGRARANRTVTGLVERFRRDTGISARFVASGGTVVLPPPKALEIVRIVQELLANVRRHSHATNVLVSLTSDDGARRLVVEDDGCGFAFEGRLSALEMDQTRTGPAIIKERARIAGAQLAVDSSPGVGARVELVFSEEGDGLRQLLESEPGFEVVAEGTDGFDALRLAREARPDILLLDVAMPRMNGLETLAAPEIHLTRVILLTAAIDPPELVRAVQLGARGVVLKESATRQLIEGIHRVMDGKFLIGTEVADDLAQALRQIDVHKEKPYGLTAREVEIVEAIAAGDSNRDIAARLNISLQTVKHHLTSVFDKTGTSTRLELALFAIRQGLVTAK